VGYGQNGDKPKRRQIKTETPKRPQNGDKPKRRQDKTAASQNATRTYLCGQITDVTRVVFVGGMPGIFVVTGFPLPRHWLEI